MFLQVLTMAVLPGTAAQAVSPTASSDEIPQLIEQMKASYDTRSWEAVYALGRIGRPAVPALMAVLRDRTLPSIKGVDAPARYQAASALGKVGPAAEEAVPLLLEILRDRSEDEGVRWQAASALGSIGQRPGEVVPALLDTLDELGDGGSSLSWYVVGALGSLAKYHAHSRPALARALPRLHRAHARMGGGQAFASLFRVLEPPSRGRLAEEDRIAEAVLRYRIKDAKTPSCVGKSVSDDVLLRLADINVTRDHRQCAALTSVSPFDALRPVSPWLQILAVDWLSKERVYTALQGCSSGFDPCSWTDYVLERRKGKWIVISEDHRPSI